MLCQHSHPHVVFSPDGGMSTARVFLHPAVSCHGNLDGNLDGNVNRNVDRNVNRNFDSDHREPQWSRSTAAGFPPSPNTAQRVPVPAKNNIDIDAHISLAAKQLKSQVDDFIKVYDGFYRLYEKEVANIKSYAGDDILQRTWSKKVEHNEKYNTGQGQEQKQLSTQRKMLAACLSQMDGVTHNGTMPQYSSDPSKYDRRGNSLEKIRAAGNRVLRLTDMAMTSVAACEDLRSELLDLGKLVDPKNKDAKMLYQFDRRETMNPQGNGKDVAGHANGEFDVQADNQTNEEGGNNEPLDNDTGNSQNEQESPSGGWSAS